MSAPETVWCRRCGKASALGGSDLCASCLEYETLRLEDVVACPEELRQDDFERFAKKLAIHAYEERPAAARDLSLKHMALHIKKAILEALPPYYVSLLEFDPEDRIRTGAAGTYTFKTGLPKAVLYAAVEKLGLWRPMDPDGGTTPA